MISKFIQSFPQKYTPHDKQIELLQKIETAYDQGNKFVICCAPTGSGKSLVSKTLGNLSNQCTSNFKELIYSYKAFEQEYGGGYVYESECLDEPAFGAFALTITKTLQDQYTNLFEDASSLKGKTNYQCQVDVNFDVETAPCVLTPKIKDDCWRQNICPYYNARNKSLTDQFSVLNYKMFLSLPNHVKRKNFIICDEASELEDELVKQFSIFIDPEKLLLLGVKIPYLYNEITESILKWVTQVTIIINEHVNDLLKKLQDRKKPLTSTEKLKLNYFRGLLNSLKLINETWGDCEYICQREGKTVKLMPFKVDALTKYIFNFADKVLLMSATIIDHKTFAKTLGIEKYAFVETESSFDPKRAPIYISNKFKLNRANLEKNLPNITKLVQAICDKHKNDKGVIHTHTMQITKYLQNNLKGNRFLFRSEDMVNETMLVEHTQATFPSVLVSPSMTFGVDLKGDLAKFQIIVKAAYLPLNDSRIKRLFDEDKTWYVDKMLCNLVQACGRGNRSAEDYCETYILDGIISDVVVANRDKLPKYFLDRFV